MRVIIYENPSMPSAIIPTKSFMFSSRDKGLAINAPRLLVDCLRTGFLLLCNLGDRRCVSYLLLGNAVAEFLQCGLVCLSGFKSFIFFIYLF